MDKIKLALCHLEHELLRNRIITENNCWICKGNRSYPTIKLIGKRFALNRISACIWLGLDVDNEKIQANHKIECSNDKCWNPDHLYLGNQSDNIKDQVRKGTHTNAARTHCIRGHKFDQHKYKNGKIVGRRCSQCRSSYG